MFRKLLLIAVILCVTQVHAQELKTLFHEGFDNGKIEGPVGKAGPNLSVPAAGKIDLDRGTLAFFVKVDKDPPILEWNIIGGVFPEASMGYWSMLMGFDARKDDFLFNFYDAGFYAPPLHLGPYLGAWKAGEWHHLAAVWDRNEGITVYIDGKRAASNWGRYRREFNIPPATLFVTRTVDEVYTFADVLTDAQIAQLARGEKPTGAPLALPPRRDNELARMGWREADLPELPAVPAGNAQMFTFARITGCIDAKRPTTSPFEGLPGSGWPALMYGATTRGRHMDITLAPGQRFDHARILVQRPLTARLAQADGATLATIDTKEPAIWHHRLPKMVQADHLAIERDYGRAGAIDFYRAEPAPKLAERELDTYSLQQATAFPDNLVGEAWRGETPTRFQNPILATKQVTTGWKLATPEFGGFQATSELPATANAYDGVVVNLVAEGLSGPTPVRIQVKEPVHGLRDWLVADAVLQPRGTGRQAFSIFIKGRPVINMPALQRKKYIGNGRYSDDLETIEAAPFSVKVTAANAVTWLMGAGGSSIGFHRTDMAKALPAATDDQAEFLREGYAQLMEGHQYGNKRIQIPLLWLAKFAPTRMEFRQMYNRIGQPQMFVGQQVPPYSFNYPVNAINAPEWAFWQMQVMNEHRRLLHWIIDNQQVETGEYGGVWNDDTDHVENWIDHALCMDDSGKIKASLHKFQNGLWDHLEEGAGKYVQDTLHYYEEGMGTLAMQMLVDYGDPVATERAMAASSHYDQWLAFKDGKYVLKSDYPGVHGPWMEREFDVTAKGGFGSYPMIPAAYVYWYNQSPTMAKYYKGWEGKLDDGGLYESMADRVAGLEAARAVYAQKLLKPMRSNYYGSFAPNLWIDEIGVSDEVRKVHAEPFKAPGPIDHYWGAKDTDNHWFYYKVTGDVRWLTESYKRTWEWFQYHDWLNTAAMPSMDRNPLPRWSLIRARMGSLAANRGALVRWPLHAISYTKGADAVAALVSENLDTKLTARFYPFTDKPHDMQLRLWRLDPGTYQVVLSKDKNDDGAPDEELWHKTMTVDRGAYLDLTLPPHEVSLLTFTPIETHKPSFEKADPAISADTVELVYDEHLVVHVHNLGSKPVDNLEVRVLDARTGEPVVWGKQVIDHIDASLDMKPKEKAVEFKNINANTYGRIIIEIDPDGKIDDLNRYNNRVEVQLKED